MTQPFAGEIRMFAGSVAPKGWALCQGQLLTVSQYSLLFNLIGTTYGGDGQVTFGLPDLRGRVPLHQGVNPHSRTRYHLGESGGYERVTLTKQQMSAHIHAFAATTAIGTQPNPGGNLIANSQGLQPYIQEDPDGALDDQTISLAGGGESHNNLQPLVCINFIISLDGSYPPPAEDNDE